MPKLKNRFMDEVIRIVRRFMRLELCAVDKVNWHKEPNDKKFNTVDVIMRDRADKEDPNPIRKQLPVLQNLLGGHCGGYNWNPRVGDLVWVFFYGGRQGIVLANAWGWHEYPVCRPVPYDIADKNGQWQKPFQDKYGDFIRQPYPKLKKPYCFRWFHGPVTGSCGPGRDWAWMLDYCQEGNNRPECDLCDKIDSISREGNRGFKFYSEETESEVAPPYRDLFFSECGSFQMFDSKEGPSSDIFSKFRGYWTIQGATDFQDLKGHLRHYPDGTIEIHSKTEWEDFPDEATGVRCICTVPESSVDWAWEAIDFESGSYIRIMKDGTIILHSSTGIILDAPQVTETGDNLTEGDNKIDGSCAHSSCSCPCGGGSCGGAAGSMEDVVAAIQAIQETQAAEESCSSALTSCCISDGEVCTSGGSACCSGSSGSEGMDEALNSCCTIGDEMVFFDNTLVTTEELSASDAAALEAMACCWENEPVTYGADWLGCI